MRRGETCGIERNDRLDIEGLILDKVIHYCWFGDREIGEQARKDIESWEKYAPDFEIKRWDEADSDVRSCLFARAAADVKAWAFVSDYIRMKKIYDYGGVYMDVGTELIKDIRPLLYSAPFMAIEYGTTLISPGLIICAEKQDPLIGEILDVYESIEFIDSDEFKEGHTVNEITTKVFEKYGYIRKDRHQVVGRWTILPSLVFCPEYGIGGFHIEDGTYSVHHYSGSWRSELYKRKREIMNSVVPVLGAKMGEILARVLSEVLVNGPKRGLKNIIQLIMRKMSAAPVEGGAHHE